MKVPPTLSSYPLSATTAGIQKHKFSCMVVHLGLIDREDEGATILGKNGKYSLNNTASPHPRRLKSWDIF